MPFNTLNGWTSLCFPFYCIFTLNVSFYSSKWSDNLWLVISEHHNKKLQSNFSGSAVQPLISPEGLLLNTCTQRVFFIVLRCVIYICIPESQKQINTPFAVFISPRRWLRWGNVDVSISCHKVKWNASQNGDVNASRRMLTRSTE